MCAEKSRAIVKEHKEAIKNLAEALLEKETVDIIDIIEILGPRPYPLGETLAEYLKEIEKRKEISKKSKENEELKRKVEVARKLKEEEDGKKTGDSEENKISHLKYISEFDKKEKNKDIL